MTNTTKLVLAIILFGSLVGLFDLLGHDLLKAAGVDEKSPYLVALVFFVLIAARLLVNRPGSTLAMGAVAGLFKLAGFLVLGRDVWVCQCGAVVIQAGALDLFISLAPQRTRLRLHLLLPAAVVACAVSYLAFVAFAARLSGGAFSQGAYASHYLATRLPMALPLSLLVAGLGYLVGRGLVKPFERLQRSRLAFGASAGVVAAAAIVVFVLDLAR
jgi:hypothetical protein